MLTVKVNDITVTLRPWTLSDLDNLVKYAGNKKIADNMRDNFPHPYTEQNGRNFINGIATDEPIKIFAMEIDGEACGSVGIFPKSDIYRQNAEMGYWLAEKHWGKGITTAVVKEIIRYGFRTWPVRRIFAQPYPL
jgi:[ribosomal protein S5]-alanine N-acetyltransferase